MALSQSVLSDLLDAFRAGEGVDLVRDAVRMVMPEVIQTEATEQIGVALADTHDAWHAGDRRSRSDGAIARRSPERDTGAVSERNSGD